MLRRQIIARWQILDAHHSTINKKLDFFRFYVKMIGNVKKNMNLTHLAYLELIGHFFSKTSVYHRHMLTIFSDL
jgi:hypothetical protein